MRAPGGRARQFAFLFLLPLACPLAACGGDEDKGEGPGALRIEPKLILGELEGPSSHVFSAVSGLHVDATGRMYVLDRHTSQLRIFTPGGELVRVVGSEGEGPGEYSAANGILPLSHDSLLVIDQRGNRYSILGPDGDFSRSVLRELPFFGWLFRGAVRDGRIYELFAVDSGSVRLPAIMGTDLYDAGAPVDTILLPIAAGPTIPSYEVTSGRSGMYIGVPFAPRAVYQLDGADGVWFGHGSEFRLIHATMAGDTLMVIAPDAVAAPVTQAELANWRAQEFVQEFVDRGGDLDMSRIPPTKPFFDDLTLDPDGNLWVSTPAGPMEAAFAVFDSDGRLLGRLRMEGFERSEGFSPVVRDDRLYVVGKDDLDVERIYVFVIEETLLPG